MKPGSGWGVFGATVDALDDPGALALQEAWVHARGRRSGGSSLPSDPYEALVDEIASWAPPAGSIRAPEPFVPRPRRGGPLSSRAARRFHEGDGFGRFARSVGRFVARAVLPARPLMIGVDHSATLGALAGLASAGIRPGLVLLDAHLDAAPDGLPLHAGNFLLHLVASGIVPAARIAVVGFPDGGLGPFAEALRLLREGGATLLPRGTVLDLGGERAARRALAGVGAPVYLSLDADVGFPDLFESVRFPDQPGLPASTVTSLVRCLVALSAGRGGVVGADLMELDVHGLARREVRKAVGLLGLLCTEDSGGHGRGSCKRV